MDSLHQQIHPPILQPNLLENHSHQNQQLYHHHQHHHQLQQHQRLLRATTPSSSVNSNLHRVNQSISSNSLSIPYAYHQNQRAPSPSFTSQPRDSQPISSTLPPSHSTSQLLANDKSSQPVVSVIGTSTSLTRPRLVDHLLTAPGFCFARSLSAHSSPLGTVRKLSDFPRSIHQNQLRPIVTTNRHVTIKTPEPTSPKITPSEISPSEIKPLNDSDQICLATSSDSQLKPQPEADLGLKITSETSASCERLNDSGQSASSQPAQPPHPQLPSSAESNYMRPSQPSSIAPSQPKPKSWADLLRKNSKTATANESSIFATSQPSGSIQSSINGFWLIS
ncbi:hypothetical protein PPACK8108_LOCUS5098 [Phakopsora pachyrhizi]|uniref:Uncharacterized protein n=1 Tax=Phakopsora pachyrhizi TaxID=170000 RepID=A0AAV0APQ1_PHAPC|nr:hypothetical protein PPACK8108_LOCUS5098 [Phakopsora pachyrhizi]